MKKIVLSICALFFVFASPLSAFEWGGLITNDTGAIIATTPAASSTTISQSNGVSIWFNNPIGEDFALSGEVLYKYNLKIPTQGNSTFINIVDLPLFKFSGETQAGSGILGVNAGRFAYVDNAGAIVSGTIDGAAIDYSVSIVKIGLFGGYSGLLNTLNNTSLARADVTKEANLYDFAYQYAPLGLSVELPYLFGNQSLGIQAYTILDCGKNDPKQNLTYASLALSGPITNIIYYSLASSLGFIDFKDLMNFTEFSLLVFPTQEISINAGVEVSPVINNTYYYSPLASKTGGQITPKANFTYGTDTMCFDLGAKYILAYNIADKNYAGKSFDLNAGFVYNVFSGWIEWYCFNRYNRSKIK